MNQMSTQWARTLCAGRGHGVQLALLLETRDERDAGERREERRRRRHVHLHLGREAIATTVRTQIRNIEKRRCARTRTVCTRRYRVNKAHQCRLEEQSTVKCAPEEHVGAVAVALELLRAKSALGHGGARRREASGVHEGQQQLTVPVARGERGVSGGCYVCVHESAHRLRSSSVRLTAARGG